MCISPKDKMAYLHMVRIASLGVVLPCVSVHLSESLMYAYFIDWQGFGHRTGHGTAIYLQTGVFKGSRDGKNLSSFHS